MGKVDQCHVRCVIFLKLNTVCKYRDTVFSFCLLQYLLVCLCGVGAGVTVFAYTIVSFRIHIQKQPLMGVTTKLKCKINN